MLPDADNPLFHVFAQASSDEQASGWCNATGVSWSFRTEPFYSQSCGRSALIRDLAAHDRLVHLQVSKASGSSSESAPEKTVTSPHRPEAMRPRSLSP